MQHLKKTDSMTHSPAPTLALSGKFFVAGAFIVVISVAICTIRTVSAAAKLPDGAFLFDSQYAIRSASALLHALRGHAFPVFSSASNILSSISLPTFSIAALSALTLFARPPKRTRPGTREMPDTPLLVKQSLFAVSIAIAFYTFLLVFAPPEALAATFAFLPIALLPPFFLLAATIRTRFSSLRLATAIPLVAVSAAMVAGSACISSPDSSNDMAGEHHEASVAIDENRMKKLAEVMTRDGFTKLVTTDTPDLRMTAERLEEISNGAISAPDFMKTVRGDSFTVDGTTAILVPMDEAESAAAEFAKAGIATTRVFEIEPDVLLVPSTARSRTPLAPESTDGCLFVQGRRFKATASDAWIRGAVSRVAPLAPEKDGWLLELAPTSLELLRAIMPTTSDNTMLEVVRNIELLSQPTIGSDTSFGKNLIWRGSRLLSPDGKATPGGKTKICHYWRFTSEASKSIGRFKVVATLVSTDGTRIEDTFGLDYDTIDVTDDSGDSAGFITIREIGIPETTPPGIWSLEIGIADAHRYYYPIAAVSEEAITIGRKAVADGAVMISKGGSEKYEK